MPDTENLSLVTICSILVSYILLKCYIITKNPANVTYALFLAT